MTKENKFKIGLCLQGIALAMDDKTLDRNKERLKLIEDIIIAEPTGDTISRHDVECIVEELENICHNAPQEVLELLAKLKNAPFATPYPKTGHWIEIVVNGQHKIKCDKCDYIEPLYITHIRNFCPNCGAKMIESEDV